MAGYSVLLAVMSSLLGGHVAGPDVASKPEVVLDLNTASLTELLSFKGIGRMYADKIYRARPFRARAESAAGCDWAPTGPLARQRRSEMRRIMPNAERRSCSGSG